MLVTYQKEHWLRIQPNTHTHQKKMWPKQKMLLRQKENIKKKVIPRLFQNSLNLELL